MTREGPKWGRERVFPANPDLADILGRTDFDFEIFYFFDFFGSQISGLGPLGPSLGPPTWARLGPTHLGPAGTHPLGPGLGPSNCLSTWVGCYYILKLDTLSGLEKPMVITKIPPVAC